MSFYDELNEKEKCLFFIAIPIVLTDIIMALCIGTILPEHFLPLNYTDSNQKTDKLVYHCQCYFEKYPIMYNHTQIDDTLQYRQKRSYNEHPYLVSLSIKTYSDSNINKERLLIGSGVILSQKLVLTSAKCVHSESEWKFVKVRASSTKWSIGGTLHSVLKTTKTPLQEIVLLTITPEFDFNSVVPVQLPDYKKWVRAECTNWDFGMYQKPVIERFKYHNALKTIYTRILCANSYKTEVCETTNHTRFQPLITFCNRLIGIGLDTSTNRTLGFDDKKLVDFVGNFMNMTVNAKQIKGCRIIYEDNCKLTEFDECDLH